jgi:hypothetical protein
MGLWQNLKDALVKSSTEGMHMPVMFDASTGKASATLFFMYIANTLALCSLIWLHFRGDPFVATITTAIYSIVWTVLYMMRRIQKAKFDLDDRSIDLEADDEEETKPSDSDANKPS